MEKKVIWGGLAGGLTFFILGFLFYGLMLEDFLNANSAEGMNKAVPDFPILIIGNLIMGFFYAIIVGSWARATTAGEGAKKGFVIGLLFSVGYDMILYSTTSIMNMNAMLADIAVMTIMGTIVGSVVAMVMGKRAVSPA